MALEELTVAAAAVTTTVSAVGIWRSLRESRQTVAEWQQQIERRTGERPVPIPRVVDSSPRSDG